MAKFYFSANIGNDTILCIAPLTDRRQELSGQELEDTSGYFLFEQRLSDGPDSARVLAQILSDAIFFLKDKFGMS
jgi:hypothetical protein